MRRNLHLIQVEGWEVAFLNVSKNTNELLVQFIARVIGNCSLCCIIPVMLPVLSRQIWLQHLVHHLCDLLVILVHLFFSSKASRTTWGPGGPGYTGTTFLYSQSDCEFPKNCPGITAIVHDKCSSLIKIPSETPSDVAEEFPRRT